MDDKLYTIPVKEALEEDCECSICQMYRKIEQSAIEFTMGPSYMEDDIRFKTDEKGFCDKHAHMLYGFNNRLGLAIMMNTHLQKINADIKRLAESAKGGGLFKKKDNSALIKYIDTLNDNCFICERVNETFERYIATIFHLWKHDKDFVDKYKKSKGFCTKHYGLLIKEGTNSLSGSSLEEFIEVTNKLYIENMERVNKDVEWFIDKFDYRFKDEPWKNAKDALPRTLLKTNSLNEDM